MNERIDELIEECTSVNDDLVYDGRDSYMKTTEYFDKEKFAELIVRECVGILDDEDDYGPCSTGVRSAAYRIKKHFGIDEKIRERGTT